MRPNLNAGRGRLPVFPAALVALLLLLPVVRGGEVPRQRPALNAARTTFVGDNGRPLRGPFTSTEWTSAVPEAEIANMRNFGFNAVHLYAEVFDPDYPSPGSRAPGYNVAEVDKIVQRTRDLGLYLVMTIGNGANNGNHNYQWAVDFWALYAPRYANETHVVYEIHNEPVAWGPPYSSPTANPPGAVGLNIDAYNIIRAHAPDTPVLLFSYAVLGDTGGANAALTDIRAFNTAVFGTQHAVWNREAVGFHGYAGAEANATAVSSLLAAGYPCFMTEFSTGTWAGDHGGLDVEAVANLERLGVSWLTFQFIPPWGVSDDVTRPDAYRERVEKSGLSWTPDYGAWPVARGVFGNGGYPWTTPGYQNNTLSGTRRIEAENFDNGGKGVAYDNGNAANPGGQYRTDETVGIGATADVGGGYAVGWTAAGDWLEYTMKVSAAGTYALRLRVAGANAGRVRVVAYDEDLTGEWTLPSTGGDQTWTTASRSVFLRPGQQVLRIEVLEGGFHLNWIEFSVAPTGPVANGTYKILNAADARALDVDAENRVVVGEYTGAANEHWSLQHIGGGEYRVNSVGIGESWTTFAGPLHLGPWWGTSGDRCFLLLPTGDGFYRIFSAGGGRSLQPSLGDPPLLDQVTYGGAAAQKWAILPPSSPAFPTGLRAEEAGPTTATLSWNAVAGATSYNVKRAIVRGGPYTTIASGVTATSYTDTGLSAGVQYYYVVSAVAGRIEGLHGAEAALRSAKLSGAVIGTPGSWNNSGNTIVRVFDNNLGTFFDGPNSSGGNGCWVGLDFGADVRNIITQIDYCPRSTFESRMVGGVFQGANQADFRDAVALYTVSAAPPAGVFTEMLITESAGFRYVRFLSPDGGWGNVAELVFYGHSASILAPVPTGLVAAPVSGSRIDLTWNTVTNASGYVVKRSRIDGGPYATIAGGLTATSFSDVGLAGGTMYYYVVSAVVDGEETPNSAQTAAATQSGSHGSLVHRYRFDETGGTTVADSVGGPVWDGSLPNGGTWAGGQLALSPGSSDYVSLPPGIVSSLSNITIMAWVNLNANETWNRIFDFGDNTTRYMFLTPQIGGTMRFAITTNGNGAEQQINSSAGLGLGGWHQVAVTLSSETGIGTLYLDGAPVGSSSGMTLNPTSLGMTTQNFLGRSQWPDPYMNGSLDEFRLYDRALSSAEIAATHALGPEELLSLDSPQLRIRAAPGTVTLSWPLAAAGFTVQSRSDLVGGNWTNLSSPAPQQHGDEWQVTFPAALTPPVTVYRLGK